MLTGAALNLTYIILSDIARYSIRLFLISLESMMATPLSWLSAPEYITNSSDSLVKLPLPVHLASATPIIAIPPLLISPMTFASFPAWYSVCTFHVATLTLLRRFTRLRRLRHPSVSDPPFAGFRPESSSPVRPLEVLFFPPPVALGWSISWRDQNHHPLRYS